MNTFDKALLAALTDIDGIGDARAYELYSHFDDPGSLVDVPDSLADTYHYVTSSTLAEIRSLEERIDEYQQCFQAYEESGITILGIEDDQYPAEIRDGPAPALLYARGDLEHLTSDSIGVSGSRETNDDGRLWIKEISMDLTGESCAIVSGGARGADTAAHEGALASTGATIVVLGTGINVPYPPENSDLFNEILDAGGLLISMRPPDAEPERHAFIDRNELIAALSNAMIFVATDGTGGTMAQYRMALEYDRPVFIPPADLDIQPRDGLEELREFNETDVIDHVGDIPTELPTSKSQQMNLDDWS